MVNFRCIICHCGLAEYESKYQLVSIIVTGRQGKFKNLKKIKKNKQ